VRSCDRRPLELGTVQGFANVYQGSEQAGDGPGVAVGKDNLDWSKVFAAALSEDVDRVTSKEESVDPATARQKARQGAGVSSFSRRTRVTPFAWRYT
jgi:hypothetical protein